MLRGIASFSIIKYFFPFPQLKNMLDYCIAADLIDRLTQYPFRLCFHVYSCAAEAGKLNPHFLNAVAAKFQDVI